MKFKTMVTREAPMIKVDWIDSQQDVGGWHGFQSNDITENKMTSIGFLIEEDADKISIVPHLGMDSSGFPNQMAGRIVIPQVQITSRALLTEN